MSNIQIDLPDKLIPVFTNPNKDYRGAYGGRGAAKTIAFANMAIFDIIRLNDKPWRFLCGRELQKSLKDSVFSVIQAQIEELKVTNFFDMGKEYIRCKNGNEFLFYGLRTNIAEVKGLHGVRRTWLEEAQKVSQSSLTYLIPTVMRDFPDCELWASYNPEDEEDPIHKLFVTDADDRTICTKINWYDNPWFPESLNKVRLRDKKHNPQRYDWIWEGSFNSNAEGAVYGKWIADMEKEGRLVKDLYDPTLPVHTAWDIGYSDDNPIWFWQQVGNEIRLIDYHESNREGMKYYAERLYGREVIVDQYGDNGKILRWHLGNEIEDIKRRIDYKYGMHFVPHDAVNKLMQAGGRSAVDQLFELGIRAKPVNATAQQTQIDLARVSLEKTWADPVLCKDGLRSLRKYQFEFNENKGSFSKTPDHDLGGYSHACFTGNTEVLTHTGYCAISELPKTGKVLTLYGWKRYINPRITKKNAKLVQIIFSDNTTVRCTPEHLFLTDKGWKYAKDLTGCILTQSSLMVERKATMGKNIICGKVKDTYREMVTKESIGKCGVSRLEKSQMDVISTIKTAIPLITIYPILSAWMRKSILATHGTAQNIKDLLGFLIPQEKRRQSGTNQKRAENGTEKTTPNHLQSALKRNVSNVVHRTLGLKERVIKHKSTAVRSVKTLRVLSVSEIKETQDVWCLTVPDVGHFSLSNGAIVKNCDAYEIIGQVWKSSVISNEAKKPKFLEDLTAKDVFFPEFTIKRADDRI